MRSFLSAFQAYADQPLTPDEADLYVRQANVAAELLGARDLPTTVAELDACVAAYRPELETTPAAREATRFMLLNPPVPLLARPGYALIAAGGVALLPGWARRSLMLPVHGPGVRLASGAGALSTSLVRGAWPASRSASPQTDPSRRHRDRPPLALAPPAHRPRPEASSPAPARPSR